jgi:hypothetical protein
MIDWHDVIPRLLNRVIHLLSLLSLEYPFFDKKVL